MAFFVRPLTVYEEKVISSLSEQYKNAPAVFKRLNIILLSHRRIKSGEISRRLQITSSTVVHWIKLFNQSGLTCLEHSLANDPPPSAQAIAPPLFARNLSELDLEILQQLAARYKERSLLEKRIEAIRLSSQQVALNEIAETLKLSGKTIERWVSQFNDEGVSCLEPRRMKAGLPAKL